MPQLVLNMPYGVNQDSVISPGELLETYFFGIPIQTQDGRRMTSDVVQFYIDAAQQEIEKYMDVKMKPTIIEERLDFRREDWYNWGFIPTTYPVRKAFVMDGFVNSVRQIQYPEQWIVTKKTNSGLYRRQLWIVPNQDAPVTNNNSVIFSGIMPHIGFMNNATVPSYWTVRYCTGFTKPPADLVNVIGKLAAINIFHILGDLILGAGIASQSIGIDGLSQSISTTSSATSAGYGSRIFGYLKDLKTNLPRLKAYYKGPTMLAL